MKLTKKPWNEGREVKQGTRSALEYAKYSAASLESNGCGTTRMNMTALLATKRQWKKIHKLVGKPAGRVQRAMVRYMMED